MNDKTEIKNYFELIKTSLDHLGIEDIETFTNEIMRAYHDDEYIIIFGNGGSAANASHFCGDFLKGVSCNLEKRFKVICLNDNVPALMAYANDQSYDEIFIGQLKNYITEKALVIGISGSGNSMNVVKALEYAKSKNVRTCAICGFDGGKIKQIADIHVHVNMNNMEAVEDIHLIVFHCVKNLVINKLNNFR